MEAFRKGLGVLFTVVGAYYCALSAFTLVRLPTITTRWIQRSGDPDFQHDYAIFMILTALGAALIGVLGLRTAIQGVGAARGRRGSWLGLFVAAVPVHWLWFLHRVAGTGMLEHRAQAVVRRTTAAQFASVCVAYFVMWLIMRERRSDGPANDKDFLSR